MNPWHPCYAIPEGWWDGMGVQARRVVMASLAKLQTRKAHTSLGCGIVPVPVPYPAQMPTMHEWKMMLVEGMLAP